MARYYSLKHLPRRKRSQLQQVVRLLRGATAVEMIVLFGSHARGDWVEDSEGGYISDYDILVVVESASLAADVALWQDLQEQARELTGDTIVKLIVYDVEELNDQLKQGSDFCREIIEDGNVLYDSHRHKLVEAELILGRKQTQPDARKCFEWYFKNADLWMPKFEKDLHEGNLNHAAFELHQATEGYYKTVLRVLARRTLQLHDLSALGKRCSDIDPAFRDIFPRKTKVDQHRFDLLDRAYRDARYEMTYTITRNELEILAKSVRVLRERTQSVCREFIASLAENSASPRS